MVMFMLIYTFIIWSLPMYNIYRYLSIYVYNICPLEHLKILSRYMKRDKTSLTHSMTFLSVGMCHPFFVCFALRMDTRQHVPLN